MNIWCVGRNYKDHAAEMKAEVPTVPLIFLKSGDCLDQEKVINLPDWDQEIHHELEIALQFDSSFEYTKAALALDLTARSTQSQLKSKGHPWTLAKSFIGSCPMSPAIDLAPLEDMSQWQLRLMVNQETRQEGFFSDVIFSPEILRHFLLKHFPVRPGDWLLTGTPSGVSSLHAGDKIEATLKSDSETLITTAWSCV